MLRKTLLVVACLSFPAAALAHLCNDVFVQARDNLAVKVDVRDGQLRIGKKATFRVYLLNTMDRNIVTIGLEVRTAGKFNAQVKPSPSWKRAPALKCVRRGGKKEYFEVTLTRKPGVPDGKYKIDLHLYNPRKKSMVFKTVDLGKAAGIFEVPKAGSIKIDGNVGAGEWGKSLLCTGFYTYTRKGKYFVNVPAGNQPRFRVSADKDNLYLALAFVGGAPQSDLIDFYAAKALDGKPVKVSIDRVAGTATCSAGSGIECKANANKSAVEVKIPRKLLGVNGVKGFYANFSRTSGQGKKKIVTYWRGNKFSVADPVEFAHFKVAQ
jgi:hypothetical protein